MFLSTGWDAAFDSNAPTLKGHQFHQLLSMSLFHVNSGREMAAPESGAAAYEAQ
jgi:hypothetical protein